MGESEPLVRIFAEIETEHRTLTSLIASLSVSHLTARPAGQWSGVDTLNHITVWQSHALTVARAQAQPDAPVLSPTIGVGAVLGLKSDEINAELLSRYGEWTVDRSLAWHNQVNTDLRRALAGLSPRRLVGGSGPHGAAIWYGRPSIIHSRVHRLELEQRLFGR